MTTTSTERRRTRSAPLGGWALIVGGITFGAFWGVSPASNDELPWFVGLAVHGVSILALLTGLLTLAVATRTQPSGRAIGGGAIVAAAGLLVVFPLLPAGLAMMGWGLWRDGWPRTATLTMLAGSTALLALVIWRYATVGEAIAGVEGAPPLSIGPAIVFVVTVVATAAGLVMIGLVRLRGRALP